MFDVAGHVTTLGLLYNPHGTYIRWYLIYEKEKEIGFVPTLDQMPYTVQIRYIHVISLWWSSKFV